MKTIYLIGAGQLGSRHLQALKAIQTPLAITVVDPSAIALKTAQERFEAASGLDIHRINYASSLLDIDTKIDLAIIATNSNVRREAIERLLAHSSVQFMILEKLLFQKHEDYEIIEGLLKQKQCQAWVNCSMRTMPFYRDLKGKLMSPISYLVTGSQYGLVTNAIHYIDHIAYLTDCYDFEVVTDALDPQSIPSKRAGFLEFNGTLTVHFKDGSHGVFTCFSQGDTPVHVEIHSPYYRVISRENEKRAWQSSPETHWQWQEVATDIPYQSQMTTNVTESILKTGSCTLTSYALSARMHLILLDGLAAFLAKHGHKMELYPFT